MVELIRAELLVLGVLAAVEMLEPLLLQQDLAERLTQAEVVVAQVIL